MREKLIITAITSFLLLLPIFVAAQGVIVLSDPNISELKLDHLLNYYVDESGDLTINDIQQQNFTSRFKPTESTLRLGTTSAAVWLRIAVRSELETDIEYVVLFEDPSLFLIDQFVVNSIGAVAKLTTGISIAPRNKPLSGNENMFYFAIKSGESLELLYRIESRNFMSLPVKLKSFPQYHRDSDLQATGQGYYYGILLVIVFYTLLSFFATRQVYFLYYALSIICFGMITGTYDGTTPERFPFLVHITNGYYDIGLSVLSNTFSMLFMSTFLKLKTLDTTFERVVKVYVLVLFLIGLLSLFAPAVSLNLIGLFSIPGMVLMIMGGIKGVRMQVSQSNFFLGSYLVLAISVIVAILSLFDVIPFTYITKYALHFGFLMSVFILSIGLGRSINQIRVDLAQQKIVEEIAKQRLIQEKNKELEKRVKEGTKDLRRKEANLRSILDNNADDSIWLVDRKFRIIDFNKYFFDSFKLAYGIAMKRDSNILDCIPVAHLREEWRNRYVEAFNGSPHIYLDEYEFGGSKQVFEIKLYPIHEHGEVSGASVFARNITDKKLTEEELKSRNESLVKLNEELDRFVYSASHDLKAPLASVLGLINITKLETEKGPIGDYLNMMSDSISKLNRFIKDIENYSRNARTEVEPEHIVTEELINEVFHALNYLDEAEDITRNIEVNTGVDFASDTSRLRVILSNLIHNAIRYTASTLGAADTQININVDIDSQEAKISINDNGPGIPEEHLKKIFKMFYRGHDKLSGTGLGLYIVKETVEKLGGTISVVSMIDQGTTFELRIPNLMNELKKSDVQKV